MMVGIARYDDLLRPVADGRPDGFCKLIADRRTHTILGAHVLGEYSAETVQTVAACMAAGMTVEQVAELQLAFPGLTEAVCMAAQKICRALGIGHFPQVWSYLGPKTDQRPRASPTAGDTPAGTATPRPGCRHGAGRVPQAGASKAMTLFIPGGAQDQVRRLLGRVAPGDEGAHHLGPAAAEHIQIPERGRRRRRGRR